jgi:hypothetical protein
VHPAIGTRRLPSSMTNSTVQPMEPDRLDGEEVNRGDASTVRSNELAPGHPSARADRTETLLPEAMGARSVAETANPRRFISPTCADSPTADSLARAAAPASGSHVGSATDRRGRRTSSASPPRADASEAAWPV